MRTLKIQSLPGVTENSWIDRDVIMLHACFQLLVDWVEKEDGLTHCNYETHKEYVDELTFLYNWWKERSKTIYSSELKDDEDQEMIERLIKKRKFLWT